MADIQGLQAYVDHLNAFLADPFNKDFHHDSPRRDTEAILAKGGTGERDAFLVGMHAGSIGSWLVRIGGLTVLDGKPAGWTDFHHGLLLEGIELRAEFFMMMKKIKKSDRGRWEAYRGAEILTHLLAVDDNASADQTAELLVRAITHGVSSPHNYYGYEPFIVNLFQVARGEQRHNPAFSEPDFGDKYADVWKYWNSVDELSQQCAKLCDLHLEIGDAEGEAARGRAHGQFTHNVFRFYPVEILAIQRIRKKLGLAVPACDHDLMKSPLADAPTEPPKLNDDLADRVRARLKKEYEGF